jgi:hypothetical protein
MDGASRSSRYDAPRRNGPGTLGVLAFALALALPRIASVAAEPSPAWLTGTALARQLAAPVDGFWSGVPLREAVTSLSLARRVAVLIDRRVDPGQTLEMQLNGLTVQGALDEIAARRGLGVTWLGPLAYLGPAQYTARLRTLAELRREETGRLPPAAAKGFLAARSMRWDDFATPRDLLAELAAASGIEIVGLEKVPHDLWAGADLPPLPLVDRLTLIAGQFDLTFQIAADGRAIALVPVPDDLAIVRSYPGGRDPARLAERWKSLVPDGQVKVVGAKIFVRGLVEDLELITGSARLAREPRPRPRGDAQGEERFTVRNGRGQLGPVLEDLAGGLHVELQIDREGLERAGISLEQPVSFSVENATLDELFEAVVKPAGCTALRRGNVLEIRPGNQPQRGGSQ